MTYETKKPRPKAILLSVISPKTTESENNDSLAELKRLATTLGIDVLKTLTQRRAAKAGNTVLGAGKLKELAEMTSGSEIEKQADNFEEKANLIIFDGELSPSQLVSLQNATGVDVLDRTGVIVDIFSRHAKTRESRVQVEIARLKYLSPRVRLAGGNSGDRVAGKVGETKLELDKRKIRDKLSELKQELLQIQKEHATRRKARNAQACVALVGYTNAGKSSLMRALTGSDVLVEDKLFATLDTTVRALFPESKPKILVSDTVGFIKKLPHDLVASFRSTLEEAANASLLLYVVDASDPSFRQQLNVTNQVLNEIGVTEIPKKLILNKIDKISDENLKILQEEFPGSMTLSTLNAISVKMLRENIIEFFEQDMIDQDIFIPYANQGLIGEIRAQVRVLNETYDENGIHLKIRSSKQFKGFKI